MALFGLQRNHLQTLTILCLNLLAVLVGADFKWYSKTLEYDDSAWIDLRSSNYSSMNVKSDLLSTLYLSFSRRDLTFKFPFYSQNITTVSVTTQGFISMTDKVYASTQYISPLMANFAPRETDPTQDIRIHQDDEMFIVQWSTMLLAEEESSDGYFTFQAQLHRDGTIKFIYKEVPMSISQIIDDTHPVVVGLSGAYKYTKDDGTSTYEPIDTIHLNKNKIAAGTTYTFKPLPSCLSETTSCTKCKELSQHCRWCPTLQRCSTGKDFLKPSWDANSCRLLSQSPCAEDMNHDNHTWDLTYPSSQTNQSDLATGVFTTPPKKDKEREKKSNDMIVIKALLISTCAIVLMLIVATLLVRRYGWRSTAFMSHVKLENKECSCNHTLIKVEDASI